MRRDYLKGVRGNRYRVLGVRGGLRTVLSFAMISAYSAIGQKDLLLPASYQTCSPTSGRCILGHNVEMDMGAFCRRTLHS